MAAISANGKLFSIPLQSSAHSLFLHLVAPLFSFDFWCLALFFWCWNVPDSFAPVLRHKGCSRSRCSTASVSTTLQIIGKLFLKAAHSSPIMFSWPEKTLRGSILLRGLIPSSIHQSTLRAPEHPSGEAHQEGDKSVDKYKTKVNKSVVPPLCSACCYGQIFSSK